MDTLKLIAILIVVGILIYRKYQLGLSLVIGAVFTGILYAVPLKTWLSVPYATVTTPANIYLVAALYFIMMLEHILTKKGIMNRILKNCSVLLPDARVVLVVIPAFIGLLPSFGGALFSAPLVQKTAQGLNISRENQCLINYWFRHFWEYFFPVYPSILLAAAIIGVSTRDIVVNFFHFGILMIIIGIIFLIRPIKVPPPTHAGQNKKTHLKDLIFVLSPILAVLILVIFCRWEVATATFTVVAALFVYYRYQLSEIKDQFIESFEFRIIFLVFGVLFFKEMMVQSGAVPAIVSSFESLGITGVMMVGILCFVVSFLTGSPQGSIGVVFPLILNFPPQMHMPLAVVGMVLSTGGHMLSPMHLCLTTTADFFGTTYAALLPRLFFLVSIMLAAIFIIYYFW